MYSDQMENEWSTSSMYTKSLDLGDNSVKTLKSIYVESEDSVEIAILAYDALFRFKERGRIPTNIVGNKFRIYISGKGRVDLLECEFEVKQ